jgi:pimeloyl-ACP methyl ester carboxylesterase
LYCNQAFIDVCNVLLTQPGQDQWTPLHLSKPFLERLNKVDVQINVLENAGHYPLEQVGILQMHVVINNFLKQHIDV